MIDQMERMNALLDAYEGLLTEKQQEILNLYYKEDFSFSEIAENLGISRAAVNDHIKRSTHILTEYEKKLHLVQNYETRRRIYDKMKTVGNDEIQQLVEQLENLE
ncbi:YlxM family DNA-binding protein [[Clostridium] innocuum]|nr:YlxM family DNA-binding protein [[Clostridium] innocuum]